MENTVLYSLDDRHVATITYNRPDQLNRINGDFRRDVNEAWNRIREDEDAWVAIVTGAGEPVCAGGDCKEGGGVGPCPGGFWVLPSWDAVESGMEIF